MTFFLDLAKWGLAYAIWVAAIVGVMIIVALLATLLSIPETWYRVFVFMVSAAILLYLKSSRSRIGNRLSTWFGRAMFPFGSPSGYRKSPD